MRGGMELITFVVIGTANPTTIRSRPQLPHIINEKRRKQKK
jgi:hypothetical protein